MGLASNRSPAPISTAATAPPASRSRRAHRRQRRASDVQQPEHVGLVQAAHLVGLQTADLGGTWAGGGDTDDFNTGGAIGVLYDLLKAVNRFADAQ